MPKSSASCSALSRRWWFCIFNLGRWQWNRIYENWVPIWCCVFFQTRRKHQMDFWMLCAWHCTLFSPVPLNEFLFWKIGANLWFWTFDGLWCSLPALQLYRFLFFLFSVLTYIIPLNGTNADALVLWLPLIMLAGPGLGVPLRALRSSPSLRILW